MYFAVRRLTLLRHPLKDVLDRLRFELASIARARSFRAQRLRNRAALIF